MGHILHILYIFYSAVLSALLSSSDLSVSPIIELNPAG